MLQTWWSCLVSQTDSLCQGTGSVQQPEGESRPCCGWGRVDVHGPCCSQKPCWCWWSVSAATMVPPEAVLPPGAMLQPEAMLLLEALWMIHSAVGSHWNQVGGLRFVISAATRNHVEVHDPLLPVATDKEPSFAVVSITEDSWLRMRAAEGFYDNFLSPALLPRRNGLHRMLS